MRQIERRRRGRVEAPINVDIESGAVDRAAHKAPYAHRIGPSGFRSEIAVLGSGDIDIDGQGGGHPDVGDLEGLFPRYRHDVRACSPSWLMGRACSALEREGVIATCPESVRNGRGACSHQKVTDRNRPGSQQESGQQQSRHWPQCWIVW